MNSLMLLNRITHTPWAALSIHHAFRLLACGFLVLLMHTSNALADFTIGSRYAIMGAGREGESCTIGGGKGKGGVANPDPISSWSELKLYYVRAERLGVKCIPLHIKIFKTKEGEDILLTQSGIVIQKRIPNRDGKLSNLQSLNWPETWRGFVSDPRPDMRYPNFNGATGTMATGLDEVTPGEHLIYDEDVVMQGAEGTWRNPYIARVNGVVNELSRAAIVNPAIAATLDPAEDNVRISTYNHGKFVDACGGTDELGMGPDISLFKSKLPEPYPTEFAKVGEHIDTCDDPRLSACIEPYWDDVKRYLIP